MLDFNSLDYNADDINEINVNQLLSLTGGNLNF
jgi:hypothetical protein